MIYFSEYFKNKAFNVLKKEYKYWNRIKKFLSLERVLIVKIYPLSGNGKPIFYKNKDYNLIIKWGNQKIKISINIINDTMKKYFLDFKTWYPLGASMTNPLKGGLGEYLNKNYPKLNPRYASVLAAIMVKEGLIENKNLKPILIRKLKSSA